MSILGTQDAIARLEDPRKGHSATTLTLLSEEAQRSWESQHPDSPHRVQRCPAYVLNNQPGVRGVEEFKAFIESEASKVDERPKRLLIPLGLPGHACGLMVDIDKDGQAKMLFCNPMGEREGVDSAYRKSAQPFIDAVTNKFGGECISAHANWQCQEATHCGDWTMWFLQQGANTNRATGELFSLEGIANAQKNTAQSGFNDWKGFIEAQRQKSIAILETRKAREGSLSQPHSNAAISATPPTASPIHSDVLAPTVPPIVPQRNNVVDQSRTPALSVDNMKLAGLYAALADKSDISIKKLNISGNRHTPVTEPSSKYNAIEIALDKTSNPPICYAQEQDDGVKFSLAKNLNGALKDSAIQKVVALAVETAKPSANFNVGKSQEEVTFKALEKALKGKFGDGYPENPTLPQGFTKDTIPKINNYAELKAKYSPSGEENIVSTTSKKRV